MKMYKIILIFLLLIMGGFSACGGSTAPETAVNEMEAMNDGQMENMEMEGEGQMENMEMEGMNMNAEVPADLDTSLSHPSEHGLYQVSISSDMDPLMLNEIHSWTVHIETPEGTAVDNAEIVVDGGMPAHQHGFPTTPQVTENLGSGDYKLEGVKFSMSGWWEMKLDITADGQTDSVTFNIVLP